MMGSLPYYVHQANSIRCITEETKRDGCVYIKNELYKQAMFRTREI